MLSGRRVFAGDDVTDTLATLLKTEPDWSALPADTPPLVLRLLKRCLRKDYRQRLADIHDAQLDIDDALAGGGDQEAGLVVAARSREWWRHPALLVAAGLAVGAAFGVFGARTRPVDNRGTPAAVRFTIDAPPGVIHDDIPALAPDGRTLAFLTSELRSSIESRRLWVRPMDAEARLIPGTEGASFPFWSADGSSIAFFAKGKLKRVALSEGATPIDICEAPSGRGGTGTPPATSCSPPTSTPPSCECLRPVARQCP